MVEGWTVSRRFSAILTALVLLAFALRLYRLDALSLRGDESFTMLFVSRPLAELFEGIRTVEPNPPLYYFLLRAALAVWGRSDFAGRFFSALFGVLAVPLIAQLGRVLMRDRKLGANVGLLAGLLWAINPYQIWHSQDVRNYTLWPALSLASLYCLFRALQTDRKGLWLAYGATALLSLYTHYYDLFLLLAENLFVVFWYRRDRHRLRRWLVVQGALALLYLPWPLLFSSRPFTYQDVTAEVPGLLGILGRTLSTFTLGETIRPEVVSVLRPALALLAVVGLGFAFRRDRRALVFLLVYLVVPSLALFGLTRWRPLFRERYLNGIAPGYSLALALGVLALARLRRGGAALATVAALAALIVPAGVSLGHYYFDRQYAKSADWRGLAAYLETHAGAEDVIVENYPDPTLAYYYHGPARRVVLPHRSAVDQVGPLPVNRVATGQALRELLAQHRRLWLIPYRSDWDPQGFVEGWLNRRARKVHEDQVDVFRVAAYEAMERATPTVPFPFRSRLGEGIELLGYGLDAEPGCGAPTTPTRVDEETQAPVWTHPISCALHLTLYWQDLAPLEVDYTVFTHLLGPDGQIQAQQDNRPQGGTFPTVEWLPGDLIVDEYRLAVRPEAPPGRYTLEIGMYRLETGERLAAYTADGQRWPDDAIRLPVVVEMVGARHSE